MTTTDEAKRERNNKLFGAVGAIVEWYDLMLYGYLSTVFARVFFPEDAPQGVALAAALGGFAIGFLMRPVGGLFFGWLGDRKGRKVSLTLAITMMTIPMIGTTVLPGYATIGWLAPILLILFRMIQGFSSGGEYSGTLVFLTEGSREGRRGRTVAIATAYAGLGILLAALVTAIISTVLDDQQMDTWGWRIPYLLGSFIIVVGIWMRTHMQETAHYERLQEEGKVSEQPIRDAIKHDWKPIIKVAVLTGYGGIAYFLILTYLVAYLEETVGMSSEEALWIGTGAALVYVLTAHFFGAVADKYGRVPPMKFAVISLIILPVPMFLLLNTGNIVVICFAMLIMLIPALAFFGTIAVACTEYVPTSHRNAAVGIGYNFGAALIGSTAPLVAQLLINWTGIETMPAWYLVVASIIVTPIVFRLPETAFVQLADVPDSEAENAFSTRVT